MTEVKNSKAAISIKFLSSRNSGIGASMRQAESYERKSLVSSTRLIELCFSFVVAFLVLAMVSFFFLRPTLKDVRSEVQAEWQDFLRAVRDRNDLLPGLIESIRGFEPSHGKLSEKLFEARSISNRTGDPGAIVSAVDDIDQSLKRIEKLARSNPDLMRYPPFAAQWEKVSKTSRKIAFTRMAYRSSSRLYNRLLASFPQNLFTSISGFVPVNSYPPVGPIEDD
ncbi:MAG: LemA family protein [Desulfomonile sp.]